MAGKLDTPLRAQVKTILLHGTNGNLPGAGGICQNLGNSSPQSPDMYLKIPTPCVPLHMTGNKEFSFSEPDQAASSAGNQCFVRLQNEQTESITGTSTKTPTTVARAAPEPGP